MGLEEIESDIHKKIEEKVNSIIKNAEKEANDIINKGKEKLFELKKARMREVQGIIDEYKKREIAGANLNARKLKLDAKGDAIEAVYGKIGENLAGMSENDKKEILSALINKAKKELQNAKYVFCNDMDKPIVSSLCSKAGLKFDSTIECRGGVIVENESREVRVDYTYESLLADFRKHTINEVANQLFGEK